MKLAFLISILFTQSCLFGQKDSIRYYNIEDSLYDPFTSLVFDRVVAFNFNYDTTGHKKLHEHVEFGHKLQKFHFNTIRKTSVKTIDSSLAKDFISIISDTSTYGHQYADCFEPRFGITFFSGNKDVLTVLVCFDCGFLESTVTLPASRQCFYDIDSHEETESGKKQAIRIRRYQKGFSEKGEQKLLDICRRLNMGYCKN